MSEMKPVGFSESNCMVGIAFREGLSTSYGISSFGSTWGAIVNFSFPGIGLFVGTDTIPTKLTAPIKGLGIGVPYNNLNLNVNFGLTFNLSKVRHLGEEI